MNTTTTRTPRTTEAARQIVAQTQRAHVISGKYAPPTSTRGARYILKCLATNQRAFIEYDHELPASESQTAVYLARIGYTPTAILSTSRGAEELITIAETTFDGFK